MVSIKLRRLRKPIYFLTNLIWANCGITLNMFTGEQTHNYHIIFQCYSSIDWLRKFHKAQMDKCGNGECHFIFLLSWIAPENAGNSYFGSPPQTFLGLWHSRSPRASCLQWEIAIPIPVTWQPTSTLPNQSTEKKVAWATAGFPLLLPALPSAPWSFPRRFLLQKPSPNVSATLLLLSFWIKTLCPWLCLRDDIM